MHYDADTVWYRVYSLVRSGANAGDQAGGKTYIVAHKSAKYN